MHVNDISLSVPLLITHIVHLMVSSTPRGLPGGVQRVHLARRAAGLMDRIVIIISFMDNHGLTWTHWPRRHVSHARTMASLVSREWP